ncbi:hypothetical protein HPB52_011157 [Rhipicephalus sanguineus]|uniref:Uncharacterized protein n=1 Tax=Rhipicephalus sanguineus TaxID=34632 RepID=A0A9D4SW56_RHISA|nr:hypothetical protein HPB52_016571 [Rhipicephalus sanguineus]KAH7951670.1 hypothetical protein HPB52_011157 [Rhipicephalus sanguineus]
MTDAPHPLPSRPGGDLQASNRIGAPGHLNMALPRSSSCSDVDDMESEGGYVEATNRRLKRKLRRTSSVSDLNYNTPSSQQTRQTYTIAYIPVAATGNLNSLNRQALTAYLGSGVSTSSHILPEEQQGRYHMAFPAISECGSAGARKPA